MMNITKYIGFSLNDLNIIKIKNREKIIKRKLIFLIWNNNLKN